MMTQLQNTNSAFGLKNIDKYASQELEQPFEADFQSISGNEGELVNQSVFTLVASLIFKC